MIKVVIAIVSASMFVLSTNGTANTDTPLEMTTYTNRTYGFSIKFPTNWVVESTTMGVIVLFGAFPGKPDNVIIDADKLPPTYDLEEYNAQSYKQLKAFTLSYHEEKEYKTEIGGEPAIVTIYTATSKSTPDFVSKHKTVSLVKDKRVYVITCTASSDYTYREGDVFDNMIRSFQFVSKELPLPTSSPTEDPPPLNLKTYTDLTYKFSIQYPENWNVLTDYAGNAVWLSEPITLEVIKKGSYATNVAVVKPAVRSVLEATLTLEDLARKVEVEYKDMLPSYHKVEKSRTLIDGEPAMVLVFTNSLEEKMAMKSKHIFLPKDQNLYIITCNALEQEYDENDDIFEEMIHSFVLPKKAQKSTGFNWTRVLIIGMGLIVGLLVYSWNKTRIKSSN